ncbi:MAG: NAD-dependent epimerase/dehydratase family protein [Candidatus Eisenbacteria bacterium]
MSPRLEAYAGAPVLITGGLGFIGSNLAHRLVELGARVTIVDSLVPSHGGNLHNVRGIEDRVRINISDVRDPHAMGYLVRDQRYLFNLAGQVSHIDSMTDPMTDLEINCRAQLSILEACRHNNPTVRIVFAGTRQQYGRPRYLPVDENHLIQPVDVNGINKMAGEWYHLLYDHVYGLAATSLRLTNTYGPRMLLKHSRQGFVPWFLRKALLGEEISIFGDGAQRRDLNYVDDVIEAMLLVATREQSHGQLYNLGHDEVVSLLEFTRALLAATGTGSYRLVPFPEEAKRIDIGDYFGSFDKIRGELGWSPRVSLSEGLSRTVAYYREHLHAYLD